ncbi:DNA-binding transcriptional regulator, IclR family [Thermomonospora echinospora]|uniref:DNA-binding transcriptional regulator, IclR family n=1 Tax=Thermomonospora echinospora TaxID=1992 RepID=A0A1H6E768_9ACTN|nr:IclR family transcriptional regulator [Thermomonospora echinospora]SEG93658.1 DNA-binding transcriptional regulator, IclR family [Thermomonospora echinospora]
MKKGDVAPASMIDRVVRVLDAFDGSAHLSLSQVVRRTGLPRSSVHRILDRLVAVRWLTREGNDYRLGIRMLELGSLVLQQNRLRDAAIPFMHQLATSSRTVVHLAVLDGTEIVYLEKIGGPPGADLPSRMGGRAPAYCTGVGKALLAYAGDEAVQKVIDGGLQARTRFTITNRGRLLSELQQVRERGAAFDREEAVRGIGCVAAAVRGPGAAVAALSVCGPIGQMNFTQLTPAVQQAAQRVWRAANARSSRNRLRGSEESRGGGWPPGALDAWATWPRLTDWF